MHAIDTPDKQFKDGNGTSELGTILPAWWLNQVQSELLAVLTAADIRPDKSQSNQLLAALNKLAVVATGDQTVNGQKTFAAATQFPSGIHLSANQTHWNGGYKAYIGADADNAHIVFGDDTLRLHGANNRISYNNHNIFHAANKPRFAEDIEGKPNTLAGYGIGNFKVETFRGDLNTLKTDGIYSLPTAVGSSHLPVENTACHIQVIAGTQPGWCRQLGYPAYTSDVYERHQVSSANDDWSPWKKLNSDGIPVGAIVSFPKAVQNPEGFLKADGTTFAQNTFPDLYRALGNTNKLPDLSRTDIGITAWFPSDRIPTGWLSFDDIRERVTESAYPELYRLLVAKYGSIANVPQAEDRFIRNAGNGLAVGTKQGDAIRNITGKIDSGSRSTEQLFDTAIPEGAFGIDKARKNWTYDAGDGGNDRPSALTFDASRVVPTADENRPKALVLKLCIKAADTLGEAVFWIKSHGETVNAGALDAGTLAQGLQDKADRDHTHTAAQIQGLDEKISTAVAAQFTRQTIGGVDIVRFPDGTMIQTGSYRFARSGGPIENEVVFPVAFADGNVKCFVSERHSGRANGERQYNWLFIRAKNHAAAIITNWYEGSCDWMAIGKAGTAAENTAGSPSTIPGIDEETLRGINEDALNEIRRWAARGFQ
ncbi:pyocin knob domain-containing protein [Neisseria lactamica]|uniref:pyocin knob domain-containing protein n=1 Tax=Neisseria lactamica TaxID=486 RepID=UPI000E0CEE22|nr:pyocin knob domain-containing protein [Neisseria lactamica]